MNAPDTLLVDGIPEEIVQSSPSKKQIEGDGNSFSNEEWHRRRAKECVTRLYTWTEELAKTLPHIVPQSLYPNHALMVSMINAYFGIFVNVEDDKENGVDYREKVKDYGDAFLLNKHLTLTVFEELALEKKENIALRRIVRQMVRDGITNDDFEDTRTLKESLDTMVQLNDRMKAQQIKMSADIYALLQQQKILDQHIENAEMKMQKMATDTSRYKHMVDHLKSSKSRNVITPTQVSPKQSPVRSREGYIPNNEVIPRPPTSNGMGAWGRTHKLVTSRSRSAASRQRGVAMMNEEPQHGLFVNGFISTQKHGKL
jgi:hypothetical protein